MDTDDARKEEQRVPTIAEQLSELLRRRNRPDLAGLLAKTHVEFDLVPGPYEVHVVRTAYVHAPLETYERLQRLPRHDSQMVLECLSELQPPKSGRLPLSGLDYRLDPGSLASPGHRLFAESTGWARVDEGVARIQQLARSASGWLDCTSLGNACLHVLISLAETVHDPRLHPPTDGVEPSSWGHISRRRARQRGCWR